MAEAQIYKIYKITSPQTEKVYIGSTKHTLNIRFSNHKCKLNCSSKLLIEFGDAEIELVETVEIDQRFIRERYWIESYGEQCVNEILPIRTKEEKREYDREFQLANREQINEYSRAYRSAHKEQIKENRNEKITCECGGKTTKANISKHRKTMKHMKFVECSVRAPSTESITNPC